MSQFETMARDFLAQNRIAVAGVSRKSENAANGIYRKLRDEGYMVFPLNPNAEVVEGDPCFPNVMAVPEPVDGVMIVTDPDHATQVARDCIEAGVPRVWMHNNTFAPSSVSEEGVEMLREAGVAVIPGGCPMMFLDFTHKCMKWVLGVAGRLPEP
ncbi:MAG: CoA-binding protein [Anaerolineales bacterium]|nr:CoA-binding protein [Anaerolineales bacterium]